MKTKRQSWRKMYESEKSLRRAAQDRGYEFFWKFIVSDFQNKELRAQLELRDAEVRTHA